jgi:hypothetical protein
MRVLLCWGRTASAGQKINAAAASSRMAFFMVQQQFEVASGNIRLKNY